MPLFFNMVFSMCFEKIRCVYCGESDTNGIDVCIRCRSFFRRTGQLLQQMFLTILAVPWGRTWLSYAMFRHTYLVV